MIKSLNQEIKENSLDLIVEELEERPEMIDCGSNCVGKAVIGVFCQWNA